RRMRKRPSASRATALISRPSLRATVWWPCSSIPRRAQTWVCACTRTSRVSGPRNLSTVPFTPIPAIDIRGGRCVRLRQGDFARETTYADDPVEMAPRWAVQGAPRLHVVDSDGARDGVRANADVIRRLIAGVAVPVQ